MLVLSAGIWFYRYYHKPHVDVAGAVAEFSLSAAELWQEFDGDEANASQKYVNKVIAVSGQITAIKTENGEQFVGLEASDLGGVNCKMLQVNPSLKVGQRVLVKGICSGYLMDVMMLRCVIENQ